MKKYNYDALSRQGEPFIHMEHTTLSQDFEPHNHDFNELVFILEGTGVHEIDGERYRLQKGDVFVIKGDSVHGFKEVDCLKLVNIMYHERYLLDFGDYRALPGFWALFVNQPRLERKTYLTLSGENYIWLQRLLERMQKEYLSRREGYRTLCLAGFYEAVVFLSRLFQEDIALNNQIYYRLGKALSFLQLHYTEEVSIQMLADICFLSKRHFSRVFVQVLGKTPARYLQDLRLEHAKGMLRQGDCSIAQAAFSSGFSDSNYFSRVFKKETGFSPKEWRNKQ